MEKCCLHCQKVSTADALPSPLVVLQKNFFCQIAIAVTVANHSAVTAVLCCQQCHHCFLPNTAITPALLFFAEFCTFHCVVTVTACCTVLICLTLHCMMMMQPLLFLCSLFLCPGWLLHFVLKWFSSHGAAVAFAIAAFGSKSYQLHCHHWCPTAVAHHPMCMLVLLLPWCCWYSSSDVWLQSKVCQVCATGLFVGHC